MPQSAAPSAVVRSLSAAEIERELATYATPLVATLHRAANTRAEDIGLREKRFLDAFEATLKYVTLVLQSKYLHDGIHDARVDEQLHPLGSPSLGMYSALLRELTGVAALRHSELGRQYEQFYKDELDPDAFAALRRLSELIQYPTPNTRDARTYKQAIDVVVNMRNKQVAHGASPEEGPARERTDLLAYLVFALLKRVRFVAERRLVHVESLAKTAEGETLHGTLWNGLVPKTTAIPAPAGLRAGHLYVAVEEREGDGTLLDVFPFCGVFTPTAGAASQCMFCNEVARSKVAYLSYTTGQQFVLTAADALFGDAQEGMRRVTAREGEEGLPPHLRRLLEVSEEARTAYHAAHVALEDPDHQDPDAAVLFLRRAVEVSPGFRQAVVELCALLRTLERPREAQQVLDDYLRLVPRDAELLKVNARLLIALARGEEALGQARRVLAMDPADMEAQQLRDEATTAENPPAATAPAAAGSGRILLLYEFAAELLVGRQSPSLAPGVRWALAGLTAALTAATALLFHHAGEPIMVLTSISLGAVVGVILWATYRIRKMLVRSRPNFAAFLRSKRSTAADQLFFDLTTPVFGCSPGPGPRRQRLREGFRLNRTRVLTVTPCVIGMTVWLYRVTVYGLVGPLVELTYGALLLLLSLAFVYLLSVLFSFHRLVRELRFQDIHFTLVQHPKLSIRYLSNLSRRISFPLVIVYFAYAFTFYLGPFLSNSASIAMLSAFLCFAGFIYYSTIFLVRRAIIENKWRLISQFSVHFDAPFNRLVEKADRRDLTRIQELVEMRDFIDGMDVWAEPKPVLLGMSLVYFATLLAATIGLSNLMTLRIMPALSRYVNTVPPGPTSWPCVVVAEHAPPPVDVQVKDVDDTFLVVYGKDVAELTHVFGQRAVDFPPPLAAPPSSAPPPGSTSGYRRCDWSRGGHGQLQLTIPWEGQTHVLLLLYNKVFHGPLLMGGGKASCDIRLSVGGQRLYRECRFIRTNNPEISHCVYLVINRVGNQVVAEETKGPALAGSPVGDFVREVERKLQSERDTTITGL